MVLTRIELPRGRIEPGSYTTGFRSATRSSPPLEAYDPIRDAIRASFDPSATGDPRATAGPVLAVVDAEQPPLRLLLGDWVLDRVKTTYADRIDTWEQWSGASHTAQH